jgi:hypothetical protein
MHAHVNSHVNCITLSRRTNKLQLSWKEEAEHLSITVNHDAFLGIEIRILAWIGTIGKWRIIRVYDIDAIQIDLVPFESNFSNYYFGNTGYSKIRNKGRDTLWDDLL